MGIWQQHRLVRPDRREHSRQASWRGDEGTDLYAARHGRHHLLADPRDAIAACRHPPARSQWLADPASRFAIAGRAGGRYGRPRALWLDRRLHEIHPHVAERWSRTAGPRAQAGDGRGRRPQRIEGGPDGGDVARHHSEPVERRRVLPWPEEILVLHLHGQRRGCADRAASRCDRLGGPANTFYWIDRKNGFGGY